MPKTIDRHAERESHPYTFRIFDEDLEAVRSIAKAEDRTRGSILREAIRIYLAKRNGK